MEGLQGIVSGRVQGVGFRYFTKVQANKGNLGGWVRNLPDGRVEFLALGNRKDLEWFLLQIKAGPIGSRVERCDFQWLADERPLKEFEIRG